MIYIYDILLNFCDCNELYDFFEWSYDDNIENIKRIKLIHVNKDILNDFIYYDLIVTNELLEKIHRSCEVYTNRKVKIIDYCILLSDGDRVLAVEFDKNGIPIYKSRLLIDEEEEISILASNLEYYDIKYTKNSKILTNRFFTRNEIIIRKFLINEINCCYNDKNYKKLRFIYQEYFDNDNLSYLDMLNKLIDSLKDIIDNKHIDLYKMLKLPLKKQV